MNFIKLHKLDRSEFLVNMDLIESCESVNSDCGNTCLSSYSENYYVKETVDEIYKMVNRFDFPGIDIPIKWNAEKGECK